MISFPGNGPREGSDILLEQIRLYGQNQELVDEKIVKLARKYGIITPYTSMLVTED